MAQRDGYIPGVPCWIDTNQPDPEAAAGFYGGLFGWEIEDVMPDDDPGRYFTARIRGGDVAAIGSIPEGAPPVAAWNTYIWTESADDTAEKVTRAGGTPVMAPFDVFDAGRMGVFADPEGAVFSVWQAGRHKGARSSTRRDRVNFNGLITRDPDRAKAFYGAVFGWETMQFGRSLEMWTLPGYGDYLERDRPGLREEMEEMGVSGFEDAVASLNVIDADQPRSRRTGTSPSPSTMRTRLPRGRLSWAGTCSCRRSMPLGCARRCWPTRRAQRSSPASSAPRTRTCPAASASTAA